MISNIGLSGCALVLIKPPILQGWRPYLVDFGGAGESGMELAF